MGRRRRQQPLPVHLRAQDLATACIQALNYQGSNLFHIGSGKRRLPPQRLQRSPIIRGRRKPLPRRLTPACCSTIAAMQLAHKLEPPPLGPYHYRMIAESFVFDCSTTRIRRELGWTPTVTNEEMMVRAYQYYAENRNEIHARTDVSAHSRPTSMGIIRLLKWLLFKEINNTPTRRATLRGAYIKSRGPSFGRHGYPQATNGAATEGYMSASDRCPRRVARSRPVIFHPVATAFAYFQLIYPE